LIEILDPALRRLVEPAKIRYAEECALVTKRLKAAAAPYMEMLVESWKIEGFQVAVDYFYKQYQEGQDISFAIDRLVGALARHAHEDGLSCHAGKLLNLLTFYAWQGDKQSMQIRNRWITISSSNPRRCLK